MVWPCVGRYAFETVIDAAISIAWWAVDKWFSNLDIRILIGIWIALPLLWLVVVRIQYVRNTKKDINELQNN